MVGIAIASIGITSLCVANANSFSITRAHKEILVANQCLQQRTEQYSAATWTQITDPTAACNLLGQVPVNGLAPASSASLLPDQTETITISAYPPVTPAVTPLVVSRDSSGTTTIVSQPPAGFYLRNALSVRIDFRETWTSNQGRRPRMRECSTVVALGGLLH